MAVPNPIRRHREASTARRSRGSGGYRKVTSFRGAGVFFHWSVLLAVLYFVVTRRSAWPAAAYLLIVLVHELGHALATVWRKEQVLFIEVHAFGGACHHTTHGTELDRVLIAWGGVVAQALLAAVAHLFLASPVSAGVPPEFLVPLVGWNLMIAASNLLPLRGFDGEVVWRIVPIAYRALRRSVRSKPERTLLRDVPPGPFACRGAESNDAVIEDEEAEALREALRRSRADRGAS